MTKATLLLVFLVICLGNALSLDVCIGQADNTLLLHPADCSKYIVCKNGLTYDIQACADGKHFNRLTTSCDTPIEAACDVTLIKNSWAESGDCSVCRSLCGSYTVPDCPTPTPCPETPSTVTPSVPETPNPATPSPVTPAPETPTPATPCPEVPSPETPATPSPETPSPGTPSTLVPETPAPGTPTPGTPPPNTPSPGTPKPGTPATPSPEIPTPSGETPSPGTPEIPSPGTPNPETPSPGTPATPAPETPTPSNDTPSPGTPATPSPVTPTPGTPSPDTPTPTPETPTISPATPSVTPSPETPSPETPSPATLSPATPSPGTPATPSPVTPSCTNNLDICVGKPDYSNVYVPGTCREYAICISGCATVLTCPNNLIYNMITRICDYPQNVNCPYPLSPPNGPSAGPSGTSCQQHGRCEGRADGTLFSASNGSSGYIICQCECEVERPCPAGLVFNNNLLVCDYPATTE